LLHPYDHSDFSAEELSARVREGSSAAVCVMAGRSFRALELTLAACDEARRIGLVNQVLVVGSAGSAEGAAITRRHAADWVDEAELMADLGPVLGKGDAMWRALERIDAELLCFCDGDLADFGLHYLVGLFGPLLAGEGTGLVKATYSRAFGDGHDQLPDHGGRVTELLARPLLEAWFPEAGRLRQPLGGEVAARHETFCSLPFMTGYAVEAVMVIDAVERLGLDAIAEVDLGTRSNDHQSLEALGRMAREIVVGISARLGAEPPGVAAIAGQLEAEGRIVIERPPMAEVAGGVAPATLGELP
jgi:glucosyl-3-phosphoglycerate synthase